MRVVRLLVCVRVRVSVLISVDIDKNKNKETNMKILWINNDGGGFADYINVNEGTTVKSFFSEKLPNCNPEDYLIRVNRQPVASDYALQEGDRVTMTPTKIEGA